MAGSSSAATAARPRRGRPASPPTADAGLDLLATKLTLPRSSLRQVPRPRLLDLLDAGTRQLLTLVSAPAGAGKTTLLASWSSSRQPPGPVAWLSLDAGDNQAGRFWAYAVGALCQSGAVPRNSVLRSLAPLPWSEERCLPLLVSGLAALPSPVVLVLDDLHDITDAAVLEGLEFLVRHAPSQLRLVLATRVDPPLPLQRLRLAGQLVQLRAADLAFTVAEAAELLATSDDQPSLSDGDLALLHARTEGWAAGLRLAALSLEGQPDPHVWLDPLLARAEVEAIRTALVAVDPVHAPIYDGNAAAFSSQLLALHERFATGLERCERREIVVSHAAFAYLARRYRLTQLPIIESLTPDAEPSPAALAALTRQARRARVTHVFFETLVTSKLAETLAREVGATALVLNPVEGLTKEQNAQRMTYIQLMDANLTNLRTALGCR